LNREQIASAEDQILSREDWRLLSWRQHTDENISCMQ